jgi:hypothetical protein
MSRPPQHFMLRRVRHGPLVPARLWWCDHDPAEPKNKLDRGRFSVYPRADIAGVEVDPLVIIDWHLGVIHGHWRFPEPISEAEYHFQLKRLRWAETNRPNDPMLQASRPADPRQMALPSFTREHDEIRDASQ